METHMPTLSRLSRFLGSCCTVGFAGLRWMYWPQSFSWLNSPLVLWSLAVFLLVDGSYGLCYWYVKRYELSVLMKPVKKAN
jgi:paspaline synthase